MNFDALENTIGLTLDEARTVLRTDEMLRALPLQIVETAPPSRPAPRPQAHKKTRASTREIAPRRETKFGELRVLHARHENGDIELTVARETLRAPSESEG